MIVGLVDKFTSMKSWYVLGTIVLWLVVGACAKGNAQDFAIKESDTVVFYGDSITAQHLYTKFVEEFVLTRYPTLHVRFVNAGVPGDSTYGGYAGTMEQRVQRDVTAFHPAMVTVMLGMNDGGYVSMTSQIDSAFRKGYNDLLDILTRENPKATLSLILPTPYDEITHATEFPGYSKTIDSIADDVADIASQRKAASGPPIVVVDFHHRLVSALGHAATDFPALSPLLIPDRIHPAPATHWIMATALLEAWHVSPVVSEVTFSAADGKAIESSRTSISGLQKTATGLRWTQLDDALPLPFDLNDAMTSVLLKESSIEQFDRQTMRVRGLPAGNYELWIDQKLITNFSADALEHGVNLALLKTPMLDQARGIDWEENRRATLDEARFILSAETAKEPDPTAAEARLQAAEDEFATSLYKQAAPKPHNFELRAK
jgi:lysophospholipase L1-like esterase